MELSYLRKRSGPRRWAKRATASRIRPENRTKVRDQGNCKRRNRNHLCLQNPRRGDSWLSLSPSSQAAGIELSMVLGIAACFGSIE